jgi:hypothetical protein
MRNVYPRAMSTPENTPTPDPADPATIAALLSGAQVYLAESYEITVAPGDPSGITNPEPETHGSVVTVGVYSTIAKAEHALDTRNATMRFMTPLGQFTGNGMALLRYLTPVPGCDDRQWQQILPVSIDALP